MKILRSKSEIANRFSSGLNYVEIGDIADFFGNKHDKYPPTKNKIKLPSHYFMCYRCEKKINFNDNENIKDPNREPHTSSFAFKDLNNK